jgi:NAD(P)-dependent dehydrogenase (short-subunit alcohol dehydrogenase family)
MFDLTGRTALVTGGSKNIGRALAMGLAAAGADVIISARRPGPLQGARDEIRERTGRRVECVVGDVRDRADLDRIVTVALEKFGGADILINNAYDNGEPEADEHRALGLLGSSDEVWQRCIAANLLAPARLCAGLCPAMRQRGNGSVSTSCQRQRSAW